MILLFAGAMSGVFLAGALALGFGLLVAFPVIMLMKAHLFKALDESEQA